MSKRPNSNKKDGKEKSEGKASSSRKRENARDVTAPGGRGPSKTARMKDRREYGAHSASAPRQLRETENAARYARERER